MLKKIPIVVSFVILAAIIWFANPAKLLDTVLNANKIFLLIGLLVSTVALSMRVVRWKFLLRKVSFYHLYPVQMLGMTISNFTPGKIAEPTKSVLLKMRSGVPVSESLVSIIWERIFDLVVLLIFAIFGMKLLASSEQFFLFGVLGMVFFSCVVITAFFTIKSRRFGTKIFSIARKFPVLKRISDNFIATFYETKFRWTHLAESFAATAAAWALDAVVLYLILMSIGIQPEYTVLCGIIALSGIIGIASSLPGGLGSTEVVMTLMITLTGVPTSTAVIGVLLMRFMSFWYNALLGGLSFIYLSKKIDVNSILGKH